MAETDIDIPTADFGRTVSAASSVPHLEIPATGLVADAGRSHLSPHIQSPKTARCREIREQIFKFLQQEEVKGIVSIMRLNSEEWRIVHSGVDALGMLATSHNRAVLNMLHEAGAAKIVVKAMQFFPESADFQEVCCNTIGRMARFAHLNVREDLIELAPAPFVIEAMDRFATNNKIQHAACQAIKRLVRFASDRNACMPPKDASRTVLRALDPLGGVDPQEIELRKRKGIVEEEPNLPLHEVLKEAEDTVRAMCRFGNEDLRKRLREGADKYGGKHSKILVEELGALEGDSEHNDSDDDDDDEDSD